MIGLLRKPEGFFLGAVIIRAAFIAEAPDIVQGSIAIPTRAFGFQRTKAHFSGRDERLHGRLRFIRDAFGVIHEAPLFAGLIIRHACGTGEPCCNTLLHYCHADGRSSPARSKNALFELSCKVAIEVDKLPSLRVVSGFIFIHVIAN
ncbi:hypothetical protein [Paucimonas lemoignei]|uniref:hypothetical protein n=1 Tax=Paucimonas lemoignei TaxID=29443 RepID=UPI001404F0D9|nr:hypothetical protein [Paucimonas lemoignei]